MSYGEQTSKITASRLIIIAIAIGAIGAIGFYLIKERAAKDETTLVPTPVIRTSDDAPKLPTKPTYTEPKPLLEAVPELNESDPALLSALKNLNGSLMGDLLVPNEIIRKFVRAVDAVDDGRVVTDYRPVKSPQGAFVVDAFNVTVSGGEVGEVQNAEQFRVSPKNNLRYSLFVQSLSVLETDAGIAVYKRFYPLMNKAYRELGVKKDNFHSVMIRAIDRALASPDTTSTITLIHPKVYYEFADPALEKLSEVDKLMLRMGSENEARVKASLTNIRAKILEK